MLFARGLARRTDEPVEAQEQSDGRGGCGSGSGEMPDRMATSTAPNAAAASASTASLPSSGAGTRRQAEAGQFVDTAQPPVSVARVLAEVMLAISTRIVCAGRTLGRATPPSRPRARVRSTRPTRKRRMPVAIMHRSHTIGCSALQALPDRAAEKGCRAGVRRWRFPKNGESRASLRRQVKDR